MRNKKMMYGSMLAVVFLLTIGLSYAYFSLIASGNDLAETINVDTTKLELKYTDGKEIKANGIEPGWTMTKTITVENTGNENVYYTLGWQKLYNEILKNEIVIRSTCTSTGVTGGVCDDTDNVVVPQTAEVTAETNKVLYPYKEAVLILPGETHTYTVTIEFINYEDKAQNYNQGKKFYGTLGIVEAYNTYSLTLNIFNDDKTPVANSSVTLHSNPMTGTTDENGAVTFDNVELGKHTLSLTTGDNNITVDLDISGGKNEVIKKDNYYKIKPKKENIKLDIIVNDAQLASISFKEMLVDYIIDNYNDLGLTKIDQVATGNQNYATVEYRYQGEDVNNYITFNDETGVWRIVGIFEAETPQSDGTYAKEYKVKIIREKTNNVYWNSNKTGTNYNDWTISSLMTTLNSGDYYNKSGKYASNGLTEQAKNQISNTKWYLGNISTDMNISKMYINERSKNVWDGNKEVWDGKVALLYPSDYMYASSSCYNKEILGKDYDSSLCAENNWLLSDSYFWTLSPTIDDTSTAMFVSDNTYSDNVFQTYAYLRPSLFLNTNATYVSGNGSTDSPFVIQ